jgi:hypothetical protein
MSDFINIRVTEAELDLITLLLEQAGTLEDSTGQPAFELLHDLMEQAARPGDWTEDLEPTDLDGHTFTVAEDHFIDAGIQAREQAKASSRAAERRALNFSARDDSNRTDQQRVDVWDANDPKNW